MEIQIRCRACDRTYPLSMALDPEGKPGHCPFCGESLAFQYSGTFISTAEAVLSLGNEFSRQLSLFAELAGGFEIKPDTVLNPIADAISRQDEALAQEYRPGWPPRPSEPVA